MVDTVGCAAFLICSVADTAAEELVSSSLWLSLRIPATVAAPLSVESQGHQLEQVAIRPVGA